MTKEIVDGVDVSGCEYAEKSIPIDCSIDNCFCYENKNCYYKQLKRLEQELYEWKKDCEKCKLFDIEKTNRDLLERIDKLEQELKWANDEEKYLKDCCIKAGKELEKYSFKWDGKEKNLVVQALQLNQLYEELEQENKELKKRLDSYAISATVPTVMYNRCERERCKYGSALEEIRGMFLNQVAWVGQLTNFEEEIYNKINEVLTP
ncbi:MAG: hypothetical protein J6S67_20750 [Methanobrevibacter sp.]|nr:hypothetical protein [Methanobrevibacter sp.]